MTVRGRWFLLLAALAAPPATADIVLAGSQHIGDCKPKGASCAGFTPSDPVTRDFMFAKPINFHVSTFVMLDKVRLVAPVDLGNQLQIYLEPVGNPLASSHFGVLSGDTFDLVPDVPLPPGQYVLLPDGGCTVNNSEASPNGFYSGCGGGEDNDFSFSSITLVTNPTTDTSTSAMVNARRHAGDSSEGGGAVGYAGRWYPDAAEGLVISMGFSLPVNRRLLGAEFYRLRDVATSAARARVFVDATQIGTLSQNSAPIDSAAPVGTSLLLLAGAHTLRVEVQAASDADDISWDDVILKFADTVASGTPGWFNAVNTGANAIMGVLSTKAAGAAPLIDIVALNAQGNALNTGYTGTVTVQLMDASVDGVPDSFTGCHSTWTAVAGYSTTVTFAAANAGRVALPGPMFPVALRKAALRMTDSATGAVACATDRFALRPDHFAVAAYHGDEVTPGASPLDNTAATGLPRHKAGRPFRIEAVAVDASNVPLPSYDGTLDSTHTTTALAPATVSGLVTTGSWTGSGATRSTDEARYDEVGAFTLQLADSTFANVDAADTSATQRSITGTAGIGRFIPDHFAFAAATPDAEFEPGCASRFTYAGQSFGYAVVPTGRITAMTGHGTPVVTRNYSSGALHKLTAVAPPGFTDATGQVVEVTAPSAPTLTVLPNGVTEVTLGAATQLRFPRGAPVAPFDAEIAITLGALTEGDGVNFLATPVGFGDPSPGNGVPFTGGANSVRFGRLVVDNAHGSENLPLAVPLRTEYWNGGFQRNTDDNCTPLAVGDLSIATALSLVSPPTLSPLSNGAWTLTLAQTAPPPPRAPGAATVTAVLGINFPWLQTDDTDADTAFDDDPSGLATFGLSNDQDRRIFQREVVGF